jgi:hypothetical protein
LNGNIERDLAVTTTIATNARQVVEEANAAAEEEEEADEGKGQVSKRVPSNDYS